MTNNRAEGEEVLAEAVDTLRKSVGQTDDAIAEIIRLQAQVARLREALGWFVDMERDDSEPTLEHAMEAQARFNAAASPTEGLSAEEAAEPYGIGPNGYSYMTPAPTECEHFRVACVDCGLEAPIADNAHLCPPTEGLSGTEGLLAEGALKWAKRLLLEIDGDMTDAERNQRVNGALDFIEQAEAASQSAGATTEGLSALRGLFADALSLVPDHAPKTKATLARLFDEQIAALAQSSTDTTPDYGDLRPWREALTAPTCRGEDVCEVHGELLFDGECEDADRTRLHRLRSLLQPQDTVQHD